MCRTWKLLKRSLDLIIKGLTVIIIADITAGQEIDAWASHTILAIQYIRSTAVLVICSIVICCITFITLCCHSSLLKVIVLCNYFIIKSRPDLAVQPVQFWTYQFCAVVLIETWKNRGIKIHYTLNCIRKIESFVTGSSSSHFDLPPIPLLLHYLVTVHKRHLTRQRW